jgi:hypothetical protein
MSESVRVESFSHAISRLTSHNSKEITRIEAISIKPKTLQGENKQYPIDITLLTVHRPSSIVHRRSSIVHRRSSTTKQSQ